MQASMSKHHSGIVVIKKIINPHENAKTKFGRVKTIFKMVFIIHYQLVFIIFDVISQFKIIFLNGIAFQIV